MRYLPSILQVLVFHRVSFFVPSFPLSANYQISPLTITVASSDPDAGPVYDAPFKPSLQGLFRAAEATAVPMSDERQAWARYEWGRWVDDDKMAELMERVNEIQLTSGVYDTFVDEKKSNNNEDKTQMSR
jgi:hypothetical protein